MPKHRIDRLVWLLIFGGLFGASLGLFVLRLDAAMGWPLVAAGCVAVVCGVVLIWLRSRMKDDAP